MDDLIIVRDPDCEDYFGVIRKSVYDAKNESSRVLYFSDFFAVGMTLENAEFLLERLGVKRTGSDNESR